MTDKLNKDHKSKKRNTREIGKEWEHTAGSFLQARGIEILEYNFNCRSGEIDIIARDDDYLVFVEVKYRRSYSYGDPSQAVSRHKQKKLKQTAGFYILKRGFAKYPLCRFDVIGICTENGLDIEWIKNAF